MNINLPIEQVMRLFETKDYSPENCRWVTSKKNNPYNKGEISDTMPGKKFGKWCVIERVQHKPDHWYYLCKCDCGTEKIISGGELRRGKTTQCLSCKNKQHGAIHKGWNTRRNNE